MSTPKGYSTQEKDDSLKAQHVTVEPIREKQHGMSVNAHIFVYNVASDAVEANSAKSYINATAHVAKVGDVIRITSGALLGQEVKVSKVETNVIYLAEYLSAAPATAVTFDIFRHIYPQVDSDGNLQVAVAPSPIQYVLDGVDTEVEEDTLTPANSRPLPVKLMGVTGPINITAGDLNVALSASNDSVAIGDGTHTLDITAAGEARVSLTTALPAGTNNIGDVDVLSQPARSHTTDSIRVGDGTDLLGITAAGEALVSLNTAIPAGTNNIGDVDVLSQPARSHTTDSIRIGDGTDLLSITAAGEALVSLTTAIPAGTNNIGDVDVLSQPARSHTTDSIRLGDGTDFLAISAGGAASVELASSIPAGTNNIGDVDVLTQPARSHTTDSIRLGDGTTLVGVTTSNELKVSTNALSVVDLCDAGIVDTSSTALPGSASLPLQIVATLAAACREIQVLDTTGVFFGVYTGAVSSEVLQFIVGPGSDQTIKHQIAAGTRVSVKRLDSTSSATVGIIALNFIG